MRRVWLAGAVALLLLAGCTDPSPDQEDATSAGVADPLPLAELAAFSGVATLNAGSNCTGTLVDTGVPDAPAYVLTNGHCTGDVGRRPQETTLGIEWFGTAEFLRAEGNLDRTVTVDVVELAYSTMRHTDTALVRLDTTLGELMDLGIEPVPIAAQEPSEGDAVVNVGVPVQDLDPDDWLMRKGECTLAQKHTVIESSWLWFGAWANDCPGIIQGSSGSPLLATDADGAPTAIAAMINTTTWGVSAADGGACFLNRPCQLDAGVPEMIERTSYAQSVAGVGSCFDHGVFALTPACPLPVSSIWNETHGTSFRGGDLPDSTGRLPAVSFVGREAGLARTALVRLGDGTACLQEETYAGAEEVALPLGGESWELLGTEIPVDLPEQEGWWAMCGVAGDDYAGAATVLFEVDRSPPVVAAGATVEDLGDGTLLVQPVLAPPEIANVRFTWGPEGEVDCQDTAAFQDFFVVPLVVTPDELPARYCVYGMDNAGNPTPVAEVPLP